MPIACDSVEFKYPQHQPDNDLRAALLEACGTYGQCTEYYGNWEVWSRAKLTQRARKIFESLASDHSHQLKYLDSNKTLMNSPASRLLNRRSATFRNLIAKVIAEDIWKHSDEMVERAYDAQSADFRKTPDAFPKNFVMPPYDHKSPMTNAFVTAPSGGPRR